MEFKEVTARRLLQMFVEIQTQTHFALTTIKSTIPLYFEWKCSGHTKTSTSNNFLFFASKMLVPTVAKLFWILNSYRFPYLFFVFIINFMFNSSVGYNEHCLSVAVNVTDKQFQSNGLSMKSKFDWGAFFFWLSLFWNYSFYIASTSSVLRKVQIKRHVCNNCTPFDFRMK